MSDNKIISLSGNKVDNTTPTEPQPETFTIRYWVDGEIVTETVTGFYGLDSNYVFFMRGADQLEMVVPASALVDLRNASEA